MHKDFSVDSLFGDFQTIKEIVGGSNINLVVPASLWIDYLSLQAQLEETND